MLNVSVSKENEIKVEAIGSGVDLVADISCIIHEVYNAMYKEDPKLAAAFRRLLLDVIAGYASPVWVIRDTGATGTIVSVPDPAAEQTEIAE